MKKTNFTCPSCGSKNAREWGFERFHILDDEFYDCLKEEFGLHGDEDSLQNYYDAKCTCDECGHFFHARVFVNVEKREIKNLPKSEYELRYIDKELKHPRAASRR